MIRKRTRRDVASIGYSFRLDPTTLEMLREIGAKWEKDGVSFASSTLVRAAIRSYWNLTHTLDTPEAKAAAVVELDRAQKGVV